MTDVNLFQTDDGGEILFVNGNPELSDGLVTMAYLCLYGGNKHDSGNEIDNPIQWWGNFDEPDVNKHYRSETQALVAGLSNVPANLLRIEAAAERDLQVMLDSGIADAVAVEAIVTAPKRLRLVVDITVGDSQFMFEFEQTAETT